MWRSPNELFSRPLAYGIFFNYNVFEEDCGGERKFFFFFLNVLRCSFSVLKKNIGTERPSLGADVHLA